MAEMSEAMLNKFDTYLAREGFKALTINSVTSEVVLNAKRKPKKRKKTLKKHKNKRTRKNVRRR